jgi:hypothetical protein
LKMSFNQDNSVFVLSFFLAFKLPWCSLLKIKVNSLDEKSKYFRSFYERNLEF